MTKPEPSEVALRGFASGLPLCGLSRLKKSLKNSSKGEPGGNCGRPGVERSCCFSGLTVWVVEMLTTDGRSLSARSAKPSGAGFAAAGMASSSAAMTATAPCRELNDSKDTALNSSNPWRGTLREKQPLSQIPSAKCTGSAPQEPYQNDADAGGQQPGGAQCLRRHQHHPRGDAFHPVRKQGVEDALDHQHEGERGPQIPHYPRQGPSSAAAACGAAGCRPAAARLIAPGFRCRPTGPLRAARSRSRPRPPNRRRNGRNCPPASARRRCPYRSA